MDMYNKEGNTKISCAFCSGKGRDPFDLLSEKSTCHVCSGTGKVSVSKPFMKCAYCKGTGNYKSYSCNVCKGKGVVPELKGDTKVCPECRGSGADISSDMECIACRGRGIVLTGLKGMVTNC